MNLRICNTGVETIKIQYGTTNILLNPKEEKIINCDTSVFSIIISHTNIDKFNTLWYIMNDIFALEQMRTILVVDGEYKINCSCDNAVLKIQSYEYVFEQNTSYQTFIFCTQNCYITRENLQVLNKSKIAKKARILYLFGGDKTLLPLTGIALIVSLIKLILFDAPLWFVVMTCGIAVCFILYLFKYFLSLKNLNRAMESTNILKYMSSQRKEYRRFSDDLVQHYFEEENKQDIYF